MPFSDSLPIYYSNEEIITNQTNSQLDVSPFGLNIRLQAARLKIQDECCNHGERNCSEKRAKSYIHHSSLLAFLVSQVYEEKGGHSWCWGTGRGEREREREREITRRSSLTEEMGRWSEARRGVAVEDSSLSWTAVEV
jgi:hypothetical protein